MPLDDDVRSLFESMLRADPDAFDESDLATARANLMRRVALRRGGDTPLVEVEDIRDFDVNGVPVREYVPFGSPVGNVVWLHGGAWIMGGFDSHDAILRRGAAEIGATVFAVDYRLAPENSYPAAYDDCKTVIEAALSGSLSRTGVGRTVVGGDSVGGQLAATITIALTRQGEQADGVVLVYPALDATMRAPSYRVHGSSPGLTTDEMAQAWYHYVGDLTREDPRISPVYATELGPLPAHLIVNAEIDPLADDAKTYARVLRGAEVEVCHHEVRGMPHGFLGMDGSVPTADKATSEIWRLTRFLLLDDREAIASSSWCR